MFMDEPESVGSTDHYRDAVAASRSVIECPHRRSPAQCPDANGYSDEYMNDTYDHQYSLSK